VTAAPTSRQRTSAGSRASALARTSEESIPEPWGPSAAREGAPRSGWPAPARSAAARRASPYRSAPPGLPHARPEEQAVPHHPAQGGANVLLEAQPRRDRVAGHTERCASRPAARRRAAFQASAPRPEHQVRSQLGQHVLDEVVGSHRDAAVGDHDIGYGMAAAGSPALPRVDRPPEGRRSPVRRKPPPAPSASGCWRRGSARPRARRHVDQLVSRRDHGHAHRRIRSTRGWPMAASSASSEGRKTVPAGTATAPATTSSPPSGRCQPAAAHGAPGRRRRPRRCPRPAPRNRPPVAAERRS